MKVEISVDKEQKEPKVVIVTSEITDEIRELERRLSLDCADTVNAYTKRGMRIIRSSDIIRIYSECQKVLCQTDDGIYVLHARLYELEGKLDSRLFVRISNSEIVNCRKILTLDASVTGTICINLEGNIRAYSSRRYVQKIKSKFGL